jgi:hypothetical protein
MSHNDSKVGDAKPNIQGDITLDLNDLSDVSASSPTEGQLIKYVSASSSWEASNAPSAVSLGYIWLGGKTNAYSNSPATSLSNGQTVYIWDDSPINTIGGSTINVTSGNANANENNWVQSIELPSGKYVFRAQSMFEFSASGYAVYQIFTGATAITNYGVVGETRGVNYGPSNSTTSGYYEITANTTFNLEMTASSNLDSIANQGDTVSEFGLIYIEKLS